MPIRKLAAMFDKAFSPSASIPAGTDERALMTATAGLLLEIALADESISPQEETSLLAYLTQAFGLIEADARALVAEAHEMRKNSIDHWALTKELRQSYSIEKRIEIVRSMWKVVYSDGSLHHYENYLVRKLADLLGLEHHVMIEAKLAVKAELGAE